MLSAVPTSLQLTDVDYKWYRKLVSHQQNITSAIKAMKGRKATHEGETTAVDVDDV